jgi:hypothetical protein
MIHRDGFEIMKKFISSYCDLPISILAPLPLDRALPLPLRCVINLKSLWWGTTVVLYQIFG